MKIAYDKDGWINVHEQRQHIELTYPMIKILGGLPGSCLKTLLFMMQECYQYDEKAADFVRGPRALADRYIARGSNQNKTTVQAALKILKYWRLAILVTPGTPATKGKDGTPSEWTINWNLKIRPTDDDSGHWIIEGVDEPFDPKNVSKNSATSQNKGSGWKIHPLPDKTKRVEKVPASGLKKHPPAGGKNTRQRVENPPKDHIDHIDHKDHKRGSEGVVTGEETPLTSSVEVVTGAADRTPGAKNVKLPADKPVPTSSNETPLSSRSGSTTNTPDKNHPTIKLLHELTRYWPGTDNIPALIKLFGESPNRKALEAAVNFWNLSGYRHDNFLGIHEWYECLVKDPNWQPKDRFTSGNGSSGKTSNNEAEKAWEAALNASSSFGHSQHKEMLASLDKLTAATAQRFGVRNLMMLDLTNDFTVRKAKKQFMEEYRDQQERFARNQANQRPGPAQTHAAMD